MSSVDFTRKSCVFYLAFWTLLCVGLTIVLLTCPRLQQLVTATELRALHVSVPRRVTWETPVEVALCARHHQSVLVRGRQHVTIDRQHVAAARTRAPQRVTVGINKELCIPRLVCTAQSHKDLIAVHQRIAVCTDALYLSTYITMQIQNTVNNLILVCLYVRSFKKLRTLSNYI